MVRSRSRRCFVSRNGSEVAAKGSLQTRKLASCLLKKQRFTEQLFALCAAEDTAPSSNPMGIRVDSKRRKKLMQKRLAMGHKQDDHELNYDQTLQ